MNICLIVAIDKNNTIGHQNKMPWHYPEDLQYFKQKTLNHYIIMGRKTFESFKNPLPNRISLIITHNSNYQIQNTCYVFNSLEKAIEYANNKNQENIFIIGGGEIYKEALNKDLIDTLYITHILDRKYEGNIKFPAFETRNNKDIIITNSYNNKNISYKLIEKQESPKKDLIWAIYKKDT